MVVRRRGGGRGLLFFIYLIFGLYFINFGLNFIKIPETFATVNKWVVFIGGALLIFSAIRHLVTRRHGYYN
jgi:hypothetical protein